MFPIKYSILDEAIAFYNTGSYLLSNIESYKSDTKTVFYNTIVAVVNISFSIELFIKSYIEGVKTHDLKLLFENLDNSLKELFISATVTKISRRDKSFNKTKFYECLEQNKDTFENWRYYYQKGKNVNVSFLYELATVLKDFSLKIGNALKGS